MEEVLVFPSTYYMLRSEELLKRKGYGFRLVPAPPQAGERCTTAIAVSSREREEIARYLEGEMVLITAVLPYEDRLARSLAQAIGKSPELTSSPPLGRLLGALRAGRRLETVEIAELLAAAEEEGGEAVLKAAEAAAREYFGGRVTALAAVALGAGGGEASGLREVAEVTAEMGRLGFVHLLLDLGGMVDIPWSAEKLKGAMGEGVIALISAPSLAARAGELVREGAVRQFLVRRRDVFSSGPAELAGEIAFLRDNRLGPIGSGNLVPLLGRDVAGAGEEGMRRLRAVLAVCRLVLGDAFLPAPEPLWREGGLAGANMAVLEATGRQLSAVAAEGEARLREMGLSLVRVERGEGWGAGAIGEE